MPLLCLLTTWNCAQSISGYSYSCTNVFLLFTYWWFKADSQWYPSLEPNGAFYGALITKVLAYLYEWLKQLNRQKGKPLFKGRLQIVITFLHQEVGILPHLHRGNFFLTIYHLFIIIVIFTLQNFLKIMSLEKRTGLTHS